MNRSLTDQEILDAVEIVDPFDLPETDQNRWIQQMVMTLEVSGHDCVALCWLDLPEPVIGLCGLRPFQSHPTRDQVIEIFRALKDCGPREDSHEEAPLGSVH